VAERHTRDKWLMISAATLLLAAVAQPAFAQKFGTLTGTVRAGSESTPLRAHLRIEGSVIEMVAGEDGAFRMSDVPIGAQQLQVRLMGYSPVLLPVDVRPDETLFLEVVLQPVVVELDVVDVSEVTAMTPQLRGFEERKARGLGTFFSRADIARIQPRLFTDILRRVPGMQIRPLQGGNGDNVSVQSSRSKPCAMQFFMNGTPMAQFGDAPVNDYISPDDVFGVEVYSGTSQIPPQFNASTNNSRCGVVVVWTLVGKTK
jgi:hypothetical protein